MNESQTSFYIVGGTLPSRAPCYVERRADLDLYEGLTQRRFCYVLTPRQMGKSSLMVRTAARLREEGVIVVLLDLTAVGQNLSAEQWYGGLLTQVGSQLDLVDELLRFWQEHPSLGPLQRWMRAIRELVLPRVRRLHEEYRCKYPFDQKTTGRLVIFVDEIDTVRSLPFSTDEFFAGIREFYNRRTEDVELERLTFCLLGVATPSDLIRDTRTTPFNIGQRIELRDFTEAEAAPLAQGLRREEREGAELLKRALYWTGGHPYLTQRLCQVVAEANPQSAARDQQLVDQLCEELFFARRAKERDDNLLFVRERMLRSEVDVAGLLNLYTHVCRGKRVMDDETNPLVSVLRLYGVTRVEDGCLKVRNRIYERVFDQEWTGLNMPDAEMRRQRTAYQRGLLRASAVAAVITALIAGLAVYAFKERNIALQQTQRADTNFLEANLRAEDAHAAQMIAEQKTSLADERQTEAEKQHQQAVLQRVRAERQELANRRQLYVAQMNLAARAWDALNLKQLRELVESNWLDPRQEDLRGFEWYYYWQLYHHDRLTLQHHSGVLAVAFSPDGKHLATGAADGKLRLWDLASGRELASFSGHSKLIRSIAFSPDGSRIASASEDHTVRMWDIATGQGLLTLNGHTDQVCSVAFSPDGKTLASGSFDHTVKLWDTMTGREFMTLKGHANWVWAIAFSPDGRNLASASEDRTIKLWNIGDGMEIRTLKGHTASVYTVAFSPDGAKLATGGYDRTAKLWEVATGRELATLGGHNLDVMSVVFSPDGGKLATGSFDRTVKLWDLKANSEIGVIKGHDGFINSVAFSPNGRLLATCSDDNTAKLWDTAPNQVPMITGHSKSVTSVKFSPDGRQLATGSRDYSVRLWNPSTGREIDRFTGLGGEIESIAFSPGGRILALANEVYAVVLLNPSTREKVFLPGHTDTVWAVVFSPDGRKLATGGRDLKIRLWDVANRRQITALEGHTAPIKSLAFSPDGALLASGSDDHTVKLWNTSPFRELFTLRGHTDAVFAVAFSPDGGILATGGVDRKIRLWDVKSGQELNVLKGHAARIKAIIFSPDGKRLASGGDDQTVRLWDTATGQELATLKGHTDLVNALAFSPDGRTLVSGSSDKTIRLWRAASEAEVRAVMTKGH